jgi:quercetin dioxygenase-like cupin family protein
MLQFFVTRADCSHHTIFPGVDIFTTAGKNMMLSLVEFQPGAVVEPHSHPHEQMGLLIEGELTFTVGSEKRTLRPGDMWRIPGGVVHSAVAGSEGVRAIDVFHPIREDYV